MNASTVLLFAADLILVVHALFAAFVVLGLVCIFVGTARHWQWVRNPWFRLAHLLAIAVVVGQAWLGEICPLTTWEMALRAKAGGTTYTGSFVAHWLGELLYHDFPPWVFVLGYSLFGAMVLASWIWVRPRGFRDRTQ